MTAAALRREPELFAPEPIRPWDYIRLRREAAGLSIAQAARPFYQRDDHRAGCEANLRVFESPQVTVKRIRDLDLQRAFPFDPDVYERLRDLPPEQHPRICRGCGWDVWTPQSDRNGDDCAWSEALPGYCTRCEQDAHRKGAL